MEQPSRPFRLLVILLLVLGQGFCIGFGPPRLAARDMGSQPLSPQQVHQLVHLAPPHIEAAAALLLDAGSQTILYEKNADERRAPASTTKMMTALVALEHGNLDDRVVVQADSLQQASFIGLSAGEQWTLEDLLYALLLPSDNAVAEVIAQHIAGSEEAFVALMNDQAARWGLKNTHFVNPHGLDAPGQYSTARDLAQIALHGLEQPVFAQIVGTREHQVGQRALKNLNQLLETYAGTQGVKTGTTDAAGECLVSAVSRPEGQAICVVLGSSDRYRDSRLLLDFYFTNYRSVPLELGPQGFTRFRKADGQEAVLVLRERRQALLPRWELPWLQLLRITQEPEPGEGVGPVGSARFSVGSAVIAELPLYLSAP